MAKSVDMKGIVNALNAKKPEVEAIISNDNTKATPLSNANDIDILGGVIIMLSDYIADGNMVDVDQESRIRELTMEVANLKEMINGNNGQEEMVKPDMMNENENVNTDIKPE